ncbi:D(5)-like dopamine receptor [Hydra vulgaris]|uniref:D(5)-like dopamine receptor n=1 Tax=Hydra vulgaris TaxID=6087 RepID=A0ABM4BH01_HYDVU
MSKPTWEIIEAIVLILIAASALLGNCMIILAFVIGPRAIKTFTNYFVVNLAVADLMVVCLSLPFWIASRLDYELIDGRVRKFFDALDILCGTTSILNLTAISLERMYAVKFPARHFNLSPHPVIGVIALTWTTGLFFTITQYPATSGKSVRWYTCFIFTMAFLIPLLIIVGSYWITFHCAVSTLRINSKRELKVAKTISVIITLFFFCWSPFFIVNMIFAFCEGINCTKLPRWLVDVTKVMHYSNSMMNFFVYGHRSPDFRRSFKAFFHCNFRPLQRRVHR